jgi:hypothetical protein
MKVGKLMPLLVLASATAPVHAVQWQTGDKHTTALDVTFTYGAQWRLDDPDDKQSAGDLPVADPNYDDANNNFDKGLASNGIRAIADFEWRYKMDSGSSFGVFARGNAWYDDKIYNAKNDNDSPVTVNSWKLYGGTMDKHNEFHPDVEDRSGKDAELLDAFIFAEIAPASDHPATLRVGRQVVNWGESAFIQNGLSAVINSADVSKASLPGTEVKEILRPLGAVSGSISLTDNISLSAYVQYEWEEIIAPPYGTFLSPVPDPLSGDGGEKFLLPVASVAAQMPIPQDPSQMSLPFIPVDRTRNQDASDSGQWGISMSWFVPQWSDTEFGFYAGNYHRKRLTIEFTNYRGTQDIDWTSDCIGNAGPAAATCIPLSFFAGAFDTASYNFDFMEDIEYYGFSWNSLIGLTDTAFSGEIIYHKDVPIQTTSLFDGLIPTVLFGAPIPGNPNIGQPASTNIYTRQDMIVTQVTFNQNFSPSWADDAGLIVEIGHIYVDNSEDDQWAGNTEADTSSWAYRAKFSATWYDGLGKMISALSGTDLIWTVDFNHDVDGVSPVVGTGYTEGAMAFSTALEATWQNTWSVKAGYTNFFGDGYNTLGQELDDHILGDRDFVSLAVKYRF